MKTSKILNEEVTPLKIASLPSRPTAPVAFGGRGFTAKDMKEAFDKLPLLIIERFNDLLDDITGTDQNSIASVISTGLAEGHTLASFFADITSGALAEILSVDDTTLSEFALDINERFTHYDSVMSIYPQTVFTNDGSITAEKARIYRMGTMRNLELSFPESIDNEYYAELSFDSGEDATVFSTSGTVRFSGDDIADECFYPAENKHYSVFLWYDGSIQGVVRGLQNA